MKYLLIGYNGLSPTEMCLAADIEERITNLDTGETMQLTAFEINPIDYDNKSFDEILEYIKS